MVSPTQLCWRYYSLPLKQRYNVRSGAHYVFSPVRSCFLPSVCGFHISATVPWILIIHVVCENSLSIGIQRYNHLPSTLFMGPNKLYQPYRCWVSATAGRVHTNSFSLKSFWLVKVQNYLDRPILDNIYHLENLPSIDQSLSPVWPTLCFKCQLHVAQWAYGYIEKILIFSNISVLFQFGSWLNVEKWVKVQFKGLEI